MNRLLLRALPVVLVIAALGAGCLARPGSPSPVVAATVRVTASPPQVVSTPRPLALLHAWDARRARAWARGDPRALRELYTPGSAAGARDVAMLRSWRSRGLRVLRMRMQVLAAELVAGSRGRLVLRVTDRLAGGVAVGTGARLPLPGDAASTRTVVLRRWPTDREAGEWRVARVSSRPTARSAPQPAQRRGRR